MEPRVVAAITVAVTLPYVLWLAYLYIHLQSGWLRPPLAITDSRPLLVVGTQSSGTNSITAELKALGLEVGHEVSDTVWSFSRDGTVSWLHGLRFLPGNAPQRSIEIMCEQSRRNMGFHPAMFRPPHGGCSYRSEWDDCWRSECASLLASEWGCAARGDCETPFETSLLQLRHPLRTAESLAVKFCARASAKAAKSAGKGAPAKGAGKGARESVGKGAGESGGTGAGESAGTGAGTSATSTERGEARLGRPHGYLVAFLTSLWPSHFGWETHGCADTVGWFWLLYTRSMLEAKERGLIDGDYKIEEASPCEIAARAGFGAVNRSGSAYQGSIDAVRAPASAYFWLSHSSLQLLSGFMDSVADGETKVTLLRYCRLAHIGICAYQVRASCVAGAKGREMRSEKLNQRNLGRVTLSLDDFTSSELREGIAEMAAQIGYEL